jgi:hypothetical protein
MISNLKLLLLLGSLQKTDDTQIGKIPGGILHKGMSRVEESKVVTVQTRLSYTRYWFIPGPPGLKEQTGRVTRLPPFLLLD